MSIYVGKLATPILVPLQHVKEKTIKGVLSHFPSGMNLFNNSKKTDLHFSFWNPNFGSSTNYEIKARQMDSIGSALELPWEG